VTGTALSTRAPLRGGALAAVAASVDVAVDPTRVHVPLCPLHAMTGAWCPLCGGLRAVAELARGHLAAAAHDNVLVLAAMPIAIALWVAAVRGRPAHAGRRGWAAVVVVAVVFTVLRNLPVGAALHPPG
jgi:hypothetical protein